MKKTFGILLIVLFAISMLLVGTGCKTTTATTAAAAETTAAVETTAAAAETTAAAAETTAAFNPKDHPIAMGMFLKVHPVVRIMIAGFMVRATELGYEPILLAPDEADAPKAYGLLEAGMAQHKVEGLCQYLFDESTAQYVKKYSDQGIPVVTGHTAVQGDMVATYKGLTAWAACSAIDYGKAAAMAIGEQVKGKGTVAVTEGSFNPTEDLAANSFIETMKANFKDIKVLDSAVEGFDVPSSIQIATAIMQANPDITGAFSTTGAGPSTWAGAQKNTGKKICAIAMDYSRVNLDLVKSGDMYAVVAQPLFEEFAKCAEMLDTILRGGTVPFDNLMPAPLVTKENVADYYAINDVVDEGMKNVK
jgi:ribose transport system substrate-binding protein